MSNLSLHVENYKAIRSASVELADLTVLAGVNASGKSTIARLFHRLVCIESDIERFAAETTYSALYSEVLDPVMSVLPDEFVQKIDKKLYFPKRPVGGNYLSFLGKLTELVGFAMRDHEISSIWQDDRVLSALNRKLPNTGVIMPEIRSSRELENWLCEALNKSCGEYERLVKRTDGSARLYFDAEVNGETLADVVVDRDAGTLFEAMHVNTARPFVSFSDGNVEIADSAMLQMPFQPLFAPRQSFYIARPAVDFPSVTSRKLKLNGVEYRIRGKKMASDLLNDVGIEAMIGGHISAPDEKPYVASSDWLYSDKQGHTFGLDRCADGIKSLATISILNRYGLLDDGTLLIIDEPEVHLHPQWVVGMARVLVKLAKKRKVCVLLTTHSPDLVHALRDFSENDGFSASTRFYLSEEAEDADSRYVYRDLGMDIGPIFSRFNVAKDQIASLSKMIREGLVS